MRGRRLEISGGALVVLALLYYLDDRGVTLWVLLACLFHELGHWGAIRLLGGRVVRLRLSCAGAELRLSSAHPLTPLGTALAALAGPGINLLPAGWLDGGRAWAGVLAGLGREELGERVTALCSDGAAAVLLGLGLMLLWESGGRNFTLLIAGLWLAAAGRKERGALYL